MLFISYHAFFQIINILVNFVKVFSILVCRTIEVLNEEPMSIITQSFVSSAFTKAS